MTNQCQLRRFASIHKSSMVPSRDRIVESPLNAHFRNPADVVPSGYFVSTLWAYLNLIMFYILYSREVCGFFFCFFVCTVNECWECVRPPPKWLIYFQMLPKSFCYSVLYMTYDFIFLARKRKRSMHLDHVCLSHITSHYNLTSIDFIVEKVVHHRNEWIYYILYMSQNCLWLMKLIFPPL